jgi:hypothetical protein
MTPLNGTQIFSNVTVSRPIATKDARKKCVGNVVLASLFAILAFVSLNPVLFESRGEIFVG